MTKFDHKAKAAGPGATLTSPVRAVRRALTHEGGPAYAHDAKSELFLLAVVNMAGEDTFYESAAKRDQRFMELVHAVTKTDPDWVARFVPWLRGTANMRSASVVAAVEYVRAGGAFGRRVVDSALLRADEPAEVLAYWTSAYGRALPQPVKRGVADAAARLYTERAALKYDGLSRAWRMADVLELTHARPRDDAQSALFRYLLDRRHDRADLAVPESLSVLTRRRALEAMPVADREGFVQLAARDATVAALLTQAGMTWEALAGWLDGPMDAAAWEAVVPSMGYMALLRNLRNFDEAGVSDAVASAVAAKLADPDEVARSRQFPYRFVSAYDAAPSLRWAWALEQALEAATARVPAFAGRTLVLVDTSASMSQQAFSARSTMTPVKAAAVFGVVMAMRGNAVDLHGFADGQFRHPVRPGGSVLAEVDRFTRRVGEVGHGTRIAEAVSATYRRHDRVVIVSDMQTFTDTGFASFGGVRMSWTYRDRVATDQLPANVPVYGFNLGGYRTTVVNAGRNNRHEFGGLNDATFTMLNLLEAHTTAGWPF
ncbi:MAG: TROVE domain-containing protein [Frankiaceae bacterium]|nr:TROVE domain-containing protein [Frankiaceae bacterium]